MPDGSTGTLLDPVMTCVGCGRRVNLAEPPRSRATDWARWRTSYGTLTIDGRRHIVQRGHVCPSCSDPR